MSREKLIAIRQLAVTMLRCAQDIRIQQVQATSDANWPQSLRAKATHSWVELNQASEAIDAELGKLISLTG